MKLRTKPPFSVKALQITHYLQVHQPRPSLAYEPRTLSILTQRRSLRSFTTTPKMTTDIPRILTFWFGTPDAPYPFERWFLPDTDLDNQIRSEFGTLVLEARNTNSSLDHWTETPTGTLALLILLDQFPRNIYRGSPDAFASDAKALHVSVNAVAKGLDRQVEPSMQGFFYLPLMHAESLLAQVASVACYEGLVGRLEVGSSGRALAEKGLESARGHRDIVGLFGRFPGRNGALGRVSSNGEEEWLGEHPTGL